MLPPLHLELIVLGAGLGALAVIAVRGHEPSAPRAAAVALAVALVLGRLAPPLVVLAALVTVPEGGVGPLRALPLRAWRLLSAAVATVVLAATMTGGWSGPEVVFVVVAATVVVATERRIDPLAHLPVVLAAAAAPVVVWACAPDTEEASVAAGTVAALVVGALASTVRHGRARPGALVCDRRWTGLLLVLVWAGAQGFRGRPGASGAVAVALAPALAALLAASWAPTRWPQWPTLARATLVVVGAAGACAAALAWARTVGLEAAVPPSAVVAGLGVVGGLAAISVAGWRADR